MLIFLPGVYHGIICNSLLIFTYHVHKLQGVNILSGFANKAELLTMQNKNKCIFNLHLKVDYPILYLPIKKL